MHRTPPRLTARVRRAKGGLLGYIVPAPLASASTRGRCRWVHFLVYVQFLDWQYLQAIPRDTGHKRNRCSAARAIPCRAVHWLTRRHRA